MDEEPLKHYQKRLQQLRDKAEADFAQAPALGPISAPQAVGLLTHELGVYQIELEMQNEELRLAQVALENSRDRYVDLYEFAPVGYLSITNTGLIHEVNLIAVTMVGFNRKNFINRRFAQFIADDDKDRWYQLLQRYKGGDSEHSYSLDLQLIRSDKSTFFAHINCLQIKSTNDQLMLRVAITNISQLKASSSELELLVRARTLELTDANLRLKQEIEDRKRIEAELEKSRIEFRLLVETMSEGLMVCDNKCIVTYINDRFCEMLKRPREEIVGHAAIEFIDETSQVAWSLQIANLKAGKVTSDEVKLKGPKGNGIWAKVSPSPLPDLHGGTVGNFSVFTDIDEHILAEYALRVSKNQLRKLSEQVMSAQEKERQRVSSELHDGIGQTLSAVKFCVEAGIKSICEHPTEESFRHLENVIPKIQHAIEEVRRISMALRPSMLDDIGVLATLTWFCRESSLVYKNISIQLQLDIKEEDIPVRIKVVIFRIVQEAFNNAVKHSSAERINIILKLVGSTIVLSIEDNGVGFDAKCVSSHGGVVSSGLGLASMRERAELASGIYSIDSTKGAGTKIQVTWHRMT
ncbi:MAG: PAS domain S-box protein [Gammaproteobacteria bacterium]|nr:PAS domain S-box protein [Gammaproteobacteria bacterium]